MIKKDNWVKLDQGQGLGVGQPTVGGCMGWLLDISKYIILRYTILLGE